MCRKGRRQRRRRRWRRCIWTFAGTSTCSSFSPLSMGGDPQQPERRRILKDPGYRHGKEAEKVTTSSPQLSSRLFPSPLSFPPVRKYYCISNLATANFPSRRTACVQHNILRVYIHTPIVVYGRRLAVMNINRYGNAVRIRVSARAIPLLVGGGRDGVSYRSVFKFLNECIAY